MTRSRNNVVLVVDDDCDLRDTMRDVLREAGYEAICVAHGLEALDWLEANGAPAAVLLDLMMPVMDGWRFMGELRAHPELATVPVLVVSTVAPHWGFPVPASRVVSKPFDVDELLARIRALAGSSTPDGDAGVG
jgi:DNA-binding response OmpR family regulator